MELQLGAGGRRNFESGNEPTPPRQSDATKPAVHEKPALFGVKPMISCAPNMGAKTGTGIQGV